MSDLMGPVRDHMQAPVRTVRETTDAAEVEEVLASSGISAVPVVDASERMVGIVGRTDLLRVGRVRAMDGGPRRVLSLPNVNARELMTATIEVVTPETPLAEAARRMVRQHLHRLFVAEDRRAAGVVSSKEMMRAIVQVKLTTPIGEVANRSIVVVKADDSLSLAIDRMALAHHSGLVVVEDEWPVGVFTQEDALQARDAPPDDRVDQWMDPRLICLPTAMPVWRAGEQAVATRARRLLAVDAEGVRGVVTGMDFARLVQG